MNKRTVQSAHSRIDALEKQMIEIQTEMKIQFKDLYNKIRQLQSVMIAITGASLFRVRSRDLVLGAKLWTALAYAVVGGAALCVVNMMI